MVRTATLKTIIINKLYFVLSFSCRSSCLHFHLVAEGAVNMRSREKLICYIRKTSQKNSQGTPFKVDLQAFCVK